MQKKKYHRCQRMSEGASSCSIIVVSSHLVHCEGGVGPGRAPSADCTVCANEAVRASNLCKAKWCGVLSDVHFGRGYPLRKLRRLPFLLSPAVPFQCGHSFIFGGISAGVFIEKLGD